MESPLRIFFLHVHLLIVVLLVPPRPPPSSFSSCPTPSATSSSSSSSSSNLCLASAMAPMVSTVIGVEGRLQWSSSPLSSHSIVASGIAKCNFQGCQGTHTVSISNLLITLIVDLPGKNLFSMNFSSIFILAISSLSPLNLNLGQDLPPDSGPAIPFQKRGCNERGLSGDQQM